MNTINEIGKLVAKVFGLIFLVSGFSGMLNSVFGVMTIPGTFSQFFVVLAVGVAVLGLGFYGELIEIIRAIRGN